MSTECSCYAGRLSGLILCGSCSGYHSCCEFMISVVPLWPEDTVLLGPITVMMSVFSSVLAWGRVCSIDDPFVAEYSTDTYSLHFGQFDFSVLAVVTCDFLH